MFNTSPEEAFLADHHQAVLATVDPDGAPETSTIYYVYNKPHLYFITKRDTKKFANLAENNDAALTVVDTAKPIAINLKGHVSELDDESVHDRTLQAIVQHAHDELGDYPPIVKLSAGEFKTMQFTVKNMVYTDYTKPLSNNTPYRQL